MNDEILSSILSEGTNVQDFLFWFFFLSCSFFLSDFFFLSYSSRSGGFFLRGEGER